MKVAPSSGEEAVRLMWSEIKTGVPGSQDSLMPPAPLVRTITFAPQAAAVLTECTTARTPLSS